MLAHPNLKYYNNNTAFNTAYNHTAFGRGIHTTQLAVKEIFVHSLHNNDFMLSAKRENIFSRNQNRCNDEVMSSMPHLDVAMLLAARLPLGLRVLSQGAAAGPSQCRGRGSWTTGTCATHRRRRLHPGASALQGVDMVCIIYQMQYTCQAYAQYQLVIELYAVESNHTPWLLSSSCSSPPPTTSHFRSQTT